MDKIGTAQTTAPSQPPQPEGPGPSTPLARPFVGLSTQGATCYMNRLLQTLFMTPDLRHRLYAWTFEETEQAKKEDSIPYQLQLLFGRLQLSQLPCVDTHGLTKSFQWDYRDSFTQHDVQEFCRVLFDAIERSVKGTAQEAIINDLYQGVLIDYVKCQTCGVESQREDKFLDVSLAVRNDTDHIYNDSLEKALDTFVRPETLSGTNQYSCEKCACKRDAVKGLRFKAFPRVFVIQLKRFDLDYRTMTRKKISDYVSFPQVLDLNRYIAAEQGKRREKGSSRQPQRFIPPDIENRVFSLSRAFKRETLPEDKEKPALESDRLSIAYTARNTYRLHREERQRRIRDCLESGEHVYELFSVMVHSGFAQGGHYYAYIKSFDNERWYLFNDSSVKEVGEEELKQTFGGENKGWSGSSASAYLLVYRKVLRDNIAKVGDEEVPGYIRTAMEEEKMVAFEEAAKRVESLKTLTLRIYHAGKDRNFLLSREKPFADLLEMALADFNLTEISRADIRLRAYLQSQDTFLDTYDGREHLSLEALKISNYKSFALEIKEPGQQFQDYDPQAITVRIIVWEEDKCACEAMTLADKSANPKRVQIKKNASLEELTGKLEGMTGIPRDQQVILRRTYMTSSAQPEVLTAGLNYRKALSDLRIGESSVLYLETASDGQYRWAREFDLESHRITIKFNSPADPAAYSQYDLRRKLVLDSRSTLRNLKDLIANDLSLSPDTFIIRRGFSRAGLEVRDLDQKISVVNMMNGSGVFVELGAPVKLDESRIFLTISADAKQGSSDGTLFSYYDLGQVIVGHSKKIREVKDLIAAYANARYPSLHLDPEHCYLREQIQERLGRTLKESDSLRDYPPADSKQICVQVFPTKVPDLTPRDIVVAFKLWNPSTWLLAPAIHIVVNKDWNLLQLGELLAEKVDIPVEYLEAAKIVYPLNFVRTELTSETWVLLNNKRDRVENGPLSLPSDGYLVVVKDKREVLKALSESEQKQLASLARPQTTAWSYEKPKERSMVITVKGESKTG